MEVLTAVVDHIHTFRQIQETSKKLIIHIYTVFTDFRRAYDIIKRTEIYKSLEEFHMPTKLL